MTTSDEMQQELAEHNQKLPPLQAAAQQAMKAPPAPGAEAEMLAAEAALGAWVEQSRDLIHRFLEARRAEWD